MNLMMLLEMAASGFGDREAFRNEGASLSYAELFRAAGAAAREISGSGRSRFALLDTSSLALFSRNTFVCHLCRMAKQAFYTA